MNPQRRQSHRIRRESLDSKQSGQTPFRINPESKTSHWNSSSHARRRNSSIERETCRRRNSSIERENGRRPNSSTERETRRRRNSSIERENGRRRNSSIERETRRRRNSSVERENGRKRNSYVGGEPYRRRNSYIGAENYRRRNSIIEKETESIGGTQTEGNTKHTLFQVKARLRRKASWGGPTRHNTLQSRE